MKTVDQQGQALDQSQTASEQLSTLAEKLRNSTDIAKSAEEMALAAEQLSSAVQEISGAATEIMAAIEQINKGSQQASAAAQQSSAGNTQIEKGATLSQERAKASLESGHTISDLVKASRSTVEELILGVSQGARRDQQEQPAHHRAGAGQSAHRQDRRLDHDGVDPDQYAGDQRIDRGRARRRVRQGLYGGLNRHPQSRAGTGTGLGPEASKMATENQVLS